MTPTDEALARIGWTPEKRAANANHMRNYWANKRPEKAGAPPPPADDKPAWPKRPVLTWNGAAKIFVWYGAPWHKDAAKGAGFRYNGATQTWYTPDFDKAAEVLSHCDPDEIVFEMLAGAGLVTGGRAVNVGTALLDSRATDADIFIPKPAGLDKDYRGYQRAGVAYAVKRFRREAGVPHVEGILFGDSPRLGKTIQAIGTLNLMPEIKTVLVIAPATALINWQRELRAWLVDQRLTMIARDYFPRGAFIVITNFDRVHKFARQIDEREWDALIVDEAHKVKNPEARRSKAVYAIRARHRMFLTGTPIVNRPKEMWPIASRLAPAVFSDEHEYDRKYARANPKTPRGKAMLAELQRLFRSTFMVRRTFAEVRSDLPPRQRDVYVLPAESVQGDLAEEQKELLEGLEKVYEAQLAFELAKGFEDRRLYDQASDQLRKLSSEQEGATARVRHLTALAKVPLAVEYIRDVVLEEEQKIILFAHHGDVIDRYHQAFGSMAVKVDGRMTGARGMAERQRSVDLFQRDPSVRVFIGSIMAAGVAITLDAAGRVEFCEEVWTPGDTEQAEARGDSVEKGELCPVEHIVLEGSIDEAMAEAVVAKQAVIDAAIDASEKAELLKNPIVPIPQSHASAHITWARIGEDAARLTPEQREEALEGLRWLADHGQDMNRIDAAMARAIAALARPNARHAALARRIVRKYREQMSEVKA